MNHNPNAYHPKSLEYSAIRGKYVRRHIELNHRFPGELKPLHLSAEMEGIVP